MQLKIDGHRGELTIARASRALAAFEGRKKVEESDVLRVAAMSLRHRLRREPLEPTGGGARIEQALEKNFPPTESQDAPAQLKNQERPSPAPQDAQLPENSLKPVSQTSSKQTQAQSPSARHGRYASRSTHKALRGRYTRAVINRPPAAKVALDATLRAAAVNSIHKHSHEGQAISRSFSPAPADLRFKQFKRKQGALFILAVDTSGSIALNRIAHAKGALVRLLQKSYIRRDRVAVVSIRGLKAEELLPPSQSMSRARKTLDELLMGGATPLASALALSLDIARRVSRQGTERVSLLLFTDGRPNFAPGQRDSVMEELRRLGASLKASSVEMTLIDTKSRFTSGGAAREMAARLGARYVYLPSSKDFGELEA
ncbi:MAG: VWA domain-containing protein [Acidobacteria bacterium]|nr:VWA domain-containing protein [Acidobacteriota bacterium]